MEVYLQRQGAEKIHIRVMDPNVCLSTQAAVEQWKDEKLADAMATLHGTSSSSSSSSSTSIIPANSGKVPEEKQKLISKQVDRSTRVYGIIFAALPEELRQQAESIPSGFAYGLWHWLETKYQSTEQDSAAALLVEWTVTRQEEGESFDSYKARVDKLHTLMAAAQEPMSKRMYSLALLDRLQPQYKQAVLALKVSGALKNPAAVVWEDVVTLINTTSARRRAAATVMELRRCREEHGLTLRRPRL